MKSSPTRRSHAATYGFVHQAHGRVRTMHGSFQSARKQRGSTMVETALMLSMLLVMMFGIIGFGHALYTYHFVSNAAREATRWASVRGSTCNQHLPILPGGCPADASDVQTYVSNVSGMGLDSTKITATTTWVAPPNNLAVCKSQPKNPGCVVEVQVQYSYQFLLPFLPSGFTMQSTSQMVISQ